MKERMAAEEKLKAAREAATLDRVAPGEQQPEVEHGFKGEETETGIHEGRRWRHGQWFEYTLDTRGEKEVDLQLTYWGGDAGRAFEILADGRVIATVGLTGERPGEFIERRYPVPEAVISASGGGKITFRFAATRQVAGGVFDVRLMKRGAGQ